jgi:hypothetical protein
MIARDLDKLPGAKIFDRFQKVVRQARDRDKRELMPLPVPGAEGGWCPSSESTSDQWSIPVSCPLLKARRHAAALRCLERIVRVLNDEYGSPWQKGILDLAGRPQCEVALRLLYRQVVEWLEQPLVSYADFKPSSYLKSRTVDYSGDVAPRAQRIEWRRLQPTLPSRKLCGSLKLESLASGPLLEFLRHPQKFILPEEETDVCPKPGAIVIAKGEEEQVIKGLADIGLLSWVHEDEVFRVKGVPCVNGLFAVPKLKNAFDKPETAPQRLIMNLTCANGRQHQFTGDMGMLPNFCSWKGLYLPDGFGLSWSAEDMQSAFYLFALPVQWRRYLAFNIKRWSPISGGRPGWHFATTTVLPMGWSSAMAVMQCVHRRVVSSLGPRSGQLPLGREVRRDRGLPLLQDRPELRSAWQVYCDDFDVLTKSSSRRLAVGRSLWQFFASLRLFTGRLERATIASGCRPAAPRRW